MSLEPCYDFLKPNEGILLAQTKASLAHQGKTYEGDAEVRLELVPNAGVYIHTSLPSLSPMSPSDFGVLNVDGRDVPGFVVWETIPVSGTVDFIWCPRGEPVIGRGGPDTSINSVVFHVFNYEAFFGIRRSVERVGNASHAIHHTELKAAGWNIELKSMVATLDTLNTLRERGGYGLTHIGCLKKEDSSTFDGKTAEEMLTLLRFFLSFSKGMWCNPCLAVGFDDKENRVWEAWSSPQGYWGTQVSWFDPNHCEQLVGLFPGFMAKWEDENWQKALHEAIYWYLSSNCSTLGRGIGVDAGIILTQAAIERLSFEYAVRDKRLVEEAGFKDLRASDKFRLLLSSLAIPIDIPASVPEMESLAIQFGWLDAPHAITDVRNSLVHPEHKRREQFDKAFYPAWNLGQWYLELALLRICEYSGTYSNRLVVDKWKGNVESVPWDNEKRN
jgi:hypothetical protein